MIEQTKKIMVVLAIALAIPTLFSGCNKKPGQKSCKSSADCRVDASGNPQNGVCHQGKCEECVDNTDCSGLKKCVNFRCETSCEVDADCGANKHCDNGICAVDCTSNAGCGGDMICARGRCMTQAQADQAGIAPICGEIQKIHFDFDRYDIKASERQHIEDLATCMEKNPQVTVWIEGHADARGTPTYNMVLSEHRAVAVKKYLEQQKGIASNRIKTVSYGDERPEISEQNEYAWQQNRRAEIRVEKSN